MSSMAFIHSWVSRPVGWNFVMGFDSLASYGVWYFYISGWAIQAGQVVIIRDQTKNNLLVCFLIVVHGCPLPAVLPFFFLFFVLHIP